LTSCGAVLILLRNDLVMTPPIMLELCCTLDGAVATNNRIALVIAGLDRSVISDRSQRQIRLMATAITTSLTAD
jgi:hypothetical protein